MLYLIGLGLDDGEITQKGLEALKDVDRAYVEFYTNTANIDIQDLEEKTGTVITELDRDEVEREDRILEEAREAEVAFLVSGDPLTATTHFDIMHRAEEHRIETEVIHAPSILTSIAETGLNVYKFGRTVTLPENASPQSVVRYIRKNDSVGLHTLVLLDIDYDAEDAAEKLTDMDQDLEGRDAVVVERANSEDMKIHLEELGTDFETGKPPHCLVLKGETDHKEEEFLRTSRRKDI